MVMPEIGAGQGPRPYGDSAFGCSCVRAFVYLALFEGSCILPPLGVRVLILPPLGVRGWQPQGQGRAIVAKIAEIGAGQGPRPYGDSAFVYLALFEGSCIRVFVCQFVDGNPRVRDHAPTEIRHSCILPPLGVRALILPSLRVRGWQPQGQGRAIVAEITEIGAGQVPRPYLHGYAEIGAGQGPRPYGDSAFVHSCIRVFV